MEGNNFSLFQRKNVLIIGLVGFLVSLAVPFVADQYILHVIIMTVFWGYLALSWNILAGYAGQTSFGHALFFGIGAYTTAILFMNYNVTPWVGLIAGGTLSMTIGVFLGYLCFRYGISKIFFTLATIAFAGIGQVVAVNWTQVTRGSVGILLPWTPSLYNFIFSERIPYYYIILFMAIIILYVTYKFDHSKTGLACVSINNDEDAAEVCGVNVLKYKLIAMALSSFFTALAGTFYVQYLLYIDPFNVFGMDVTMAMVMPAIVGGTGTVFGPMVGSLFMTPTSEWLRAILGRYSGVHMMIYGILMITVMIFLPGGILKGVASWIRNRSSKQPVRRAT